MQEIHCTIGLRSSIVRFLQKDELLVFDRPVYVVFDTNTRGLFPDYAGAACILPAGEAHKSWESVSEIISGALDAGLGRDGCIVGVGGGVVCDIAAFAASIYMRGISSILIPTTLLAMVDASLGGKTGIDFASYKNIIGTFSPSEEVRVCPSMIQTLSDREYRNGVAEVLKHALLQGGEFFELFTSHYQRILDRDIQFLERVVYASLQIKRLYIEQDPTERSGVREQLNFGHTFGHALETVTGFTTWSHGEAVAWGIAKALEAGCIEGITDRDYAGKVLVLLDACGFAADHRITDVDMQRQFLEALRKDKKNREGKIRFILQRDAGSTLVANLSDETILAVITGTI